MLAENKRRLLYNKRIKPNTFVFFFSKGPTEISWSVRDYSVPGSVALQYAAEFKDAAGQIPPAYEIRATAEYNFPAPAHPTTDLDYWHAQIQAMNTKYLAGGLAKPLTTDPPPRHSRPTGLRHPGFRS